MSDDRDLEFGRLVAKEPVFPKELALIFLVPLEARVLALSTRCPPPKVAGQGLQCTALPSLQSLEILLFTG